MAIYELTDPNGNKIRVEGPSGATREQIVGIYNNTMAEREREPERRLRAGLENYYGTQRDIAGQIARSRKPTFGDYLGEIPKGLIGGAAGLVETGALGLAALLPEDAENVVRDGIKKAGQAVQDYVPPDFNLEDSIPRKVSEAGGSFAGIVGASLINPVAGATLAVSAGAGEASERARAAGATQEERNLAALKGILPGALELIPATRLVKGIKQVYRGEANPVQLIKNRILRASREGGIEAAQETASSIAQNMIEQGYNPEQGTFEGSGESAGIGFTVGALAQSLLDLATPRTRGGTSDVTDVEPEEFIQEELDLQGGEDAPTRLGLQTNFEGEQGELFPRSDLGQAPERPAERDPRQTEFDFDERVEETREPDLVDRMQQKLLTGPEDLGLTVDSKGEARTRDQKTAARAEGMQVVEQARSEIRNTGEISSDTMQKLRTADVPFEAVSSVLKGTRYEPALDRIEGAEAPAGIAALDTGPRPVQDQASFDAAVARARAGGLGQLTADIAQNEQAAQERARERQALAAAERGDIEAFEQPDLFAIEREQDERKYGRPEPTPEAAQVEEVEQARTDPDLLSLIEQDKAREDSARVRKATEVERQKQEDIDVDTELGLRDMQERVTEPKRRQEDRERSEQLSFRGELRQPKATSKGITPLVKPAVTSANVGELKGAADARSTDAAASGVGIPPIKSSSADGPAEAPESTSDTTTSDKRGMGRSVRGARRTTVSEGTQSDTLDVFDEPINEDAALKEAIDDPKPVQVDLPKQRARKRTKVKSKSKRVTQKAEADTGPGRRNVIGGKATPAGAKRGPIPEGIKGVKRPKPKKPEAKQVAQLYTEETPAVVKEAFGGKQDVATTNPFSDADNKKIKDKLLAGFSKSDKSKKEVAPIVAYLRAYPNPFDGLKLAIFDLVHSTPLATNEKTNDPSAQAAAQARQYMGGVPAKKGQLAPALRAIAWARANLSKEANLRLDRAFKEIQLNQVRTVLFESGSDRVMDAREKRLFENRKSLEAAVLGGYANEKDLLDAYPDIYPNMFAVREAMNDPAFGRMALELGAVVGLDIPMHPMVIDAIKQGNLRDALSNVASTNGSQQVRQIAAKFANVAGDTKLVTVKNLKAEDGRAVAGLFDPKTNTISLDADTGINTHTLIHEMSHAGMSASLADPKNGFGIQLKKLFKDLDGLLGTAYGSKDPDEFLAEAMGNQEFRSELASINPKGEPVSALQRFFNIANNYLSKILPFVKSRNLTALQEVDALVDALLAPAPVYRYANQMAMMTTADGVKKFTQDVVDATQKTINKGSREQFKFSVRDFFTQGFSKKSKNLLLRLTGLQGLGDIAESVGLGKMGHKLDELVASQRGEIQTANKLIERKIGEILTKLNKGTTEQAQKRKEALDRLIYDNDYGATIYQVDPTKPQGTYINKDGSPRMDNDGNDLLEVWNKQRADWKALGPEGQAVFNEMRAVYKDQYEKLRAVVMRQIDELVQNPDDAKKLKRDIFAKLFDASTLDVYFPLMREGDYVLRYEVKNPKSSREATVVQTFTTDAERQDAAKMFRANKDYKNVEIVEEVSARTFKGTGVDPSFAYDALSILDKNKVPQDVKDQIIKLFINSLPETSFAKSLQKRKGTPGYMQDSVYALKTKGYSLASQTAKLKYGALLRQYEADLDAFEQVALPKAKSLVGKGTERLTAAFNDVKAELKDRAQFARKGADNKNIEAVARRLNQTAFIYTIGFNASSALVNLSQIPLFVAPFLGGKHGYVKTYAAIKSAYGNTLLGGKRGGGTNSILDFYDISDKGTFTLKKGLKLPEGKEAELKRMEALVQTASQRGLLGQGFLAEAMGLNETSRIKKGSKIGNAVDNASVLSAWLFNHAEQLNRQVTLMASFNLALDSVTKGKANKASEAQIEEAVKQAIYDTQQTNGGTFLETAPSIAREGIGRVAFMYKNYGLQMYYTMLKTAKTAMDSDKGKLFGAEGSPERKAAVKQLIGMHGSALFFAGIQGLPLYGAVKLIANLFFLDDEEEDFDTIVRQYTGEGWYKGAITEFAGLDVASRMALTGLLIQENRYNSNPSLEETLGFYAGGPALSVANRIMRGSNDLLSGETQRGIESILPAGLSNVYKSTFGRYAQQGGIYTRRNDPIYDDLTNGDLVALTLGIRPTEYSFRTETSGVLKNIDIAVNKKRSFLNKQYYVAMSMGDYEKMMDVYDDMIKFNERHPEAAITPDSIERSMKRHAETTKNMHYGRSFSSTYGATIKDIRDAFKQ